MTLRQEKVAMAIKKTAGEFIKTFPESRAMVTPIRADISKDFKNATVFITVFPDSEEKDTLAFLKRKRTDFRNFFKKEVKLKSIPFFDFEIDVGEKNRQRIDELSGE